MANKKTVQPSFVDEFCAQAEEGLSIARRYLAAAQREHGDEIPDKKTVEATATLISGKLKAAGNAPKTCSNRASVARKVLRNHTALAPALEMLEKDKSWERSKRGFDTQTVERVITEAHKLNQKNSRVPAPKQLVTHFLEVWQARPKGKTPVQKAEAAFKALLKSGTGAKKWVAVIEAATKAAEKNGIAIP